MPLESDLPKFVAPIPGSQYFNAHERNEIEWLASAIQHSHTDIVKPVLAAIYSQGLMVFPNPIQRWIVKFVVKTICRRQKCHPYGAWLIFMKNLKDEKSYEMFRDGVVKHMLHGKDREDPKSAGGFSQREITFIANVLHTAREASFAETKKNVGTSLHPLDRAPRLGA